MLESFKPHTDFQLKIRPTGPVSYEPLSCDGIQQVAGRNECSEEPAAALHAATAGERKEDDALQIVEVHSSSIFRPLRLLLFGAELFRLFSFHCRPQA